MEPSGRASRRASRSCDVEALARQTSTIASLMSTPRASMPAAEERQELPRPHPRSTRLSATEDRQVFRTRPDVVAIRGSDPRNRRICGRPGWRAVRRLELLSRSAVARG